MEEHGSLPRNPARGIVLPPQPLLAPRQLTPDQRFVLRTLVERERTPRSEAIFALGYWAGCRVSDIAWLRMDDAHVGSKIGWVRVGHKGGKLRDLDLVNDARRPLYTYLNASGRTPASPYVFTSQRSNRLTEAGIHHWFRALKARATKREWDLIGDLTFHDLRHDFAHRVRVAGWALEEVAYYLGHVRSCDEERHASDPDDCPLYPGEPGSAQSESPSDHRLTCFPQVRAYRSITDRG
jgi:site-specific recombinase XerC